MVLVLHAFGAHSSWFCYAFGVCHVLGVHCVFGVFGALSVDHALGALGALSVRCAFGVM
jgi:hypothetical protein